MGGWHLSRPASRNIVRLATCLGKYLMPLIALLACRLLTDQIALSSRITYSTVAIPASKLADQLSTKTGFRLECAPQTKHEILVVRAREVKLQELLDRIAQATDGEWVRTPTGFRLERPAAKLRAEVDALIAARSAKFKTAIELLQKKTTELPPFDDAAAKKLAERLSDAIGGGSPSPPAPGGMRTLPELASSAPAGRLLTRYVALLDPTFLAQLPTKHRVVFSSEPTKMQRPFPAGMDKLVVTFRQEYGQWVTSAEPILHSSLSALERDEVKRIATDYAELLRTMSNKLGEIEPAKMRQINGVSQRAPAQRLMLRLIADLDPKMVADLPIGHRVVFANRPTRMQRPLPPTFERSIKTFVDEQTEWARIAGPLETAAQGAVRFGYLLTTTPPNIGRILFVGSASRNGTNFELRLYSITGDVAYTARMDTADPVIAPPEPPVPNEPKFSVTWSPESQALSNSRREGWCELPPLISRRDHKDLRSSGVRSAKLSGHRSSLRCGDSAGKERHSRPLRLQHQFRSPDGSKSSHSMEPSSVDVSIEWAEGPRRR